MSLPFSLSSHFRRSVQCRRDPAKFPSFRLVSVVAILINIPGFGEYLHAFAGLKHDCLPLSWKKERLGRRFGGDAVEFWVALAEGLGDFYICASEQVDEL
jgi:hypothetical protein